MEKIFVKVRAHSLRRTTLLAIGLGGFLAGIGAARLFGALPVWWMVLTVFLTIALYHKRSKFTLFAIIVCGLTVGLWRGGMIKNELHKYTPLYGQKIVVQGVASGDAVYGDKSQLSFDITNVRLVEPEGEALVGKLAIKGFGANMVYRGDAIQVEGRLYQIRGSKQGSISFADISVVTRGSSKIEDLRRQFQAGMQSALPEPHASFALGLLIGQRSTLPKKTTDELRAVGLTHIIAVSGYNLTIIVYAVRRMLKGRSKFQTFAVTSALIGLFLLFTGFSASIVRAAIVSGLGLLAWYHGRRFRPIVLLLLAAATTAGWYPLYLWSDVGWYLSFLAFSGVLLVAPVITKRIYRRKQAGLVGQVLVESTAAQLMTLPLIMYVFGEVSLIALLANLLVVPLVPLAMFLSLVAGLTGMAFASISGWAAWPAKLVLTYMLDVTRLLAGIPHVLTTRAITLVQMGTLYGLIAAVAFVAQRKFRPKSGIITGKKLNEDTRWPVIVNGRKLSGKKA